MSMGKAGLVRCIRCHLVQHCLSAECLDCGAVNEWQQELGDIRIPTSGDSSEVQTAFAATQFPQKSCDMLQEIFCKQDALMHEYGVHPEQLRMLPFGSVEELAFKIVYALLREVVEIGDELPWRWYRTTKPVDRQAMYKEIVDALHLVVEIGIMFGMTAEMCVEVYREVNLDNIRRVHEEIQRRVEGRNYGAR